MDYSGAVVKHEDATFSVVQVPESVLDDSDESVSLQQRLQSEIDDFQGLKVLLVIGTPLGEFRYYGDDALAGLLSEIPSSTIQWKTYSLP